MARPLPIIAACALLLLAAALSAVGNWAQYRAIEDVAVFSATRGVAADQAALGSMRSLLLWKGGLVVLFLVALTALLAFGRSRAARLLLTIGIAAGLAATFLLLRGTLDAPALVQAGAAAGAVILLWLPASTAWLAQGKTGA